MVNISAAEMTVLDNGCTRLSADVGGVEVYFDMPSDLAPEARGELFLGVGLFLAINRSEDLVIDPALPVCPDLHARLPLILKYFQQWNPDFNIPAVTARLEPVPARPGMVISSFSGGVDSMFTFKRHRDEITHLMVLDCFDEEGVMEPFEPVVEKAERFAAGQGKTLLPVSTNIRQVTEAENISFDYLHGPALCTLATAFGADKFFIPSSHTASTLKPWGSHPLIDPLWSTATTGIEHEGLEISRAEKTRTLSVHPDLLSHLQVCWNSKLINCGKCSKCIRTMLVLHELGAENLPFPDVDPFALVDKLQTTSDIGVSHIWDLWQFMKKRGNHETAALLRKRIDKYLFKRSREAFVKALIGKKGQALYHKWRGTGWRGRRVMMLDPDNFE